jgi:deoxyribonuclease V
MNVPHLHDWNIAPAAAIALQKTLAQQVDHHTPLDFRRIRLVAGADVSVRPNEHGEPWSHAAIAVLEVPGFRVVETVYAALPTPFPYIPGLLSFREGPVYEAAFRELAHQPDVVIFDGMGRAHMRRIGIATHMGLWLGVPTIGCGKTRLVGTYTEPANEAGASSPLYDAGEIIGDVVRTRAGVKPVYVSPGHLCDRASAVALTLACTTRYRLPEPIRAAHSAAGKHV